MNLTTFATWVGIVAFVLAVPMSVLANVLTPKVQLFWAGTAKRRAAYRLWKLEEELKRLQWYDDNPIDAIGSLLFWVSLFVIDFAVTFLAFVSAAWLPFESWVTQTSHIAIIPLSIRHLILIGTLLNEIGFSLVFLLFAPILFNCMKTATMDGRDKRRQEIAVAQNKLLKKYPDLPVDNNVRK